MINLTVNNKAYKVDADPATLSVRFYKATVPI